jgi:hypothetical protein
MVMGGLVGCELPVSVADGLGVSIRSKFAMQSNGGMKKAREARRGESRRVEKTYCLRIP